MIIQINKCEKCGCEVGSVIEKSMHNELRCNKCLAYIKNISKKDYDRLVPVTIFKEDPQNEQVDSCSLCVPNHRINPYANYCSACGNKLYKKIKE